MTRENSSEEVILLSLKIKGVSQGKEEDTTYKRVSYWYTVRKLYGWNTGLRLRRRHSRIPRIYVRFNLQTAL